MILDSLSLKNLNKIYFKIYFMKNILFLSKHSKKRKKLKNVALQLAQKLKANMHYWRFPLLTYSITIQAIREYLLTNNIDLIVLDPGNLKYIEDLLAEYKPQDDNPVECPILIIKRKTDNFYVNNILAVFSYLHDEHINIKVLKSIADAYDSKIHMLYIVNSAKKEADRELESLELIAQNNHLNNYSANILVNEAIEDGIGSFSRRRNANIIALIGFDQLRLIKLNKNLLELKGPMQFSVFELVKF
jgi:hypothetical protein